MGCDVGKAVKLLFAAMMYLIFVELVRRGSRFPPRLETSALHDGSDHPLRSRYKRLPFP
jgi:hypothetical protein